MVESVGSRCGELPAQTLSSILWAFAHLRQSRDIVFFASLAEACELRIRDFQPQVQTICMHAPSFPF